MEEPNWFLTEHPIVSLLWATGLTAMVAVLMFSFT